MVSEAKSNFTRIVLNTHVLTLLLLFSQSTLADTSPTNDLFSSSTVLKLSLNADFENMCREREDVSCDYVESSLSYSDIDKVLVVLPVEIKIRGGWRALRRNCMVPPLFVRFLEKDTKGTIFQGQSMLPLTTHCHDKSIIKDGERIRSAHFEQNLLKEYFAYKMYNQLSKISLKTRLVKIEYIGAASRTRFRYAFFTEHFQSLAKRSNTIVLPRKVFNEELINLAAMDKVTLFNYMIGNLDWSIVRHRNIVLLGYDDGEQVPVPYDFDMSGVVNAMYATPPPLFPVENVRERYYLGFCHPNYSPLIQVKKFESVEYAILDQIQNTPGLTSATRNSAARYINSFFRIAKTSNSESNVFIRQCRPWPPLKNGKHLEERKRTVEQW